MNSFIKKDEIIIALNYLTVFLLLIITIGGICSFDTAHSYEIINQYGDTVKIWGAGIYAHDSYFKAPIFIGSDFTVLVFIVPLFLNILRKIRNRQSIEYYVRCFGALSYLLYYSASLAFGVTYNHFHLLYIALFGICFYQTGLLFIKLYTVSVSRGPVCSYSVSKGMKIFLFLAGISLFTAWLPDIIVSIIHNASLGLIEVYTTEITYILDMAIISPLMILTLRLIQKNSFTGYVFLRMIFKVCIGVGIMLPVQTAVQLRAGIKIPVPALITKVLIFVLLALSAVYFEYRLKREAVYTDNIIQKESDEI